MGTHVLPLFYNVNPSDIRNQTNTVGEAFVKHEERFKNDEMKIQMWKIALIEATNLSGKHLDNMNEPEFICEIIKWVNSILVKKASFEVAKYPVGIESRVQDVNSLLAIDQKNDTTCMVGIFGIGGIGKTTIVKAIYNSIAFQFECSCFLGDIRETSNKIGGLINLQKKLLSKILGGSSLIVDNVDHGITLIKQRLRSLRVLLVLDDVDKLDHLEKLAGKRDWFGLGSRIIIATRDAHLLIAHGVDSIYQVNVLNDNEALQLFSWHAFGSEKPYNDFVKLTKHVLSYAGGLPLALEVLGSELSGKSSYEWINTLDKYKKIPNKTIQEILKISYDGLDETVKAIFLDIACFFKGQESDHVTSILEGCGLFPYSGLSMLECKSLIWYEYWFSSTQSYRTLEMHDLLQEMGREIVRQESPKEPGKRSRLWFHEDVNHVLQENTGTNEVEGILIDLPKSSRIHLSPNAFENMKMLRLLINRNAYFSEEPNFLSNGLRLLDWPKYSGESFPSNFCGTNIVVLKMHDSQLKKLEGVQNFQSMKIMDFTNCEFLEKIPDVSRIPHLVKLILDGCKNLVVVHPSVGYLKNLVLLSAVECYNLTSFPSSIDLTSLGSLFVCGCSRLKNFPKIENQMKKLEYIDFRYTGIEELPLCIGHLVEVKQLLLSGCTNLTNLPDGISELEQLEELSLDYTDIKELPSSSIGYLGRITTLDLEGCTNLMNLPDNIYQLQCLVILRLKGCEELREILRLPPNVVEVDARGCVSLAIFLEEARTSEGVRMASPTLQSLSLGNNVVTESNFSIQCDCPSSLKFLSLSRSAIVSLPTWLHRFVGLEELYLNRCKQLEEIPELPPNMKKVNARGCTSLKRFQFNNINDLTMLEEIDFSNCHENMGDDLQIRLMSEGYSTDRKFGCIFPGNKIPNWFSHRKEVSNTKWCEIVINEAVHLDGENTTFAFSTVIGTEGVHSFKILVEVINNGQRIYFHRNDDDIDISFVLRNGDGRWWYNQRAGFA
ncbi:disease resistance protein RPV1-like [Corylus avellana]|uniref:disease resistance protein RPV1-like n=1 Tax=Corylus avellana TaxID=13451 RepID=UPI00286B4273|nr:disease resistance protein RPV1-like [Corylus avellana]